MMTNKKERTEGRDQGVSRELVWFCKEKKSLRLRMLSLQTELLAFLILPIACVRCMLPNSVALRVDVSTLLPC